MQMYTSLNFNFVRQIRITYSLYFFNLNLIKEIFIFYKIVIVLQVCILRKV